MRAPARPTQPQRPERASAGGVRSIRVGMHATVAARFALTCLLCLAVSVAFARRFQGAPPTAPPAVRPARVRAPITDQADALRDGGRVDPNRASVEELALLPGVGPRLAREIVATRTRTGPYRSLSALRRVRGLGPKTLAKLAPLLHFPLEELEHPADAQGDLGGAADPPLFDDDAGADVEPHDPAPRR
jgi:competence ComEA-like helix-hairpin-helix protein